MRKKNETEVVGGRIPRLRRLALPYEHPYEWLQDKGTSTKELVGPLVSRPNSLTSSHICDTRI
jgi:hypothetical protein